MPEVQQPDSTEPGAHQSLHQTRGGSNEDPRPYLHHLAAEIPAALGSVAPEDIPLGRLRYVELAPYPRDQFQRTYDWMVSWGLIDAEKSYQVVVNNLVSI